MDAPEILFEIRKNCRVCLQEALHMCEMFLESEKPHWKMLQECARVEVLEGDGLPAVICHPCVMEMQQAHYFVTKCQDTDVKLRLALAKRIKKEDAKNLTLEEYNALADVIKLESDNNKDTPSNSVKEESCLSCDSDDSPLISKPGHSERSLHSTTKKGKFKIKRKICNVKISLNNNIKRERKHILNDGETYPKKCSECHYVAKCRSVMIIHTRTHTNEKPFLCNLCGKAFKVNDGLKAHFIRRHSKDKKGMNYKCDTCEKYFYRRKDLEVHIRVHTGETPFMCKYCPKRFSQRTSLSRHVRIHTGDRPFKCNICSKSFTCSSGLTKHQAVHTDERKFSCQQCNMLFKTKTALTQHLIIHKNSKDIVCEQCGMTFNKRGNLTIHIKRMHSEDAGQCYYCKKKFSKLSEHLIVHTTEKPFQCDICSKCFNRKGRLRAHMSMHNNVKKFPCSVQGCTQTFPLQCMLIFHELKFHKKQTPYVCEHCNKGFFRSCDMNRHVRVYHSDQPSVKAERITDVKFTVLPELHCWSPGSDGSSRRRLH